jgi:hypothetical protein
MVEVNLLSVFGPERALDQQVNLCCVLPNPDGDAKRIHGDLSWFGRRRPYVQRGEKVLYFFAPKCLCRGYKLRERKRVSGLKEVLLVLALPLSFFAVLGGSPLPLLL